MEEQDKIEYPVDSRWSTVEEVAQAEIDDEKFKAKVAEAKQLLRKKSKLEKELVNISDRLLALNIDEDAVGCPEPEDLHRYVVNLDSTTPVRF